MNLKTIMIITVPVLLVLATLAAAYFYPITKITEPAKDVKFNTILQGSENNLLEGKSLVIKSEQQWSDFTAQLISTQLPYGTPDFSKNNIIVAAMGEQPTGGYDIEIVRIDEFPDKIQVGVVKRVPAESCMVTQAITSPFHIVEIEKTEKPIEFSYSTNELSC